MSNGYRIPRQKASLLLASPGRKTLPEASERGFGGFPGMKMMVFVKKVPFSASEGVFGGLEDVLSLREDVLSGRQFTFSFNEDVLSSREKVFSLREKVFSSREKVLSGRQLTFSFNKDVSSLNEKVLSLREKVFSLKEKVLSSREEVLSEADNGVSEPLELIKKRERSAFLTQGSSFMPVGTALPAAAGRHCPVTVLWPVSGRRCRWRR